MNLSALFLLVLALAGPAPRQAAEPSAHFKPIEFVVGSCWIGTFPDGKQTDEHCFEWVFGGKFVRDRHVVRGGAPYEGESLYYWDAASNELAWSYWNSAGMMLHGAVQETPEGLAFPPRGPGGSGGPEVKNVWTRTGPDSYRATVSRRDGDGWKTLWTMELVRRR